jgi:chaperonin GroEL
MNPMDLKRGIDKAVTALVEELKKSPAKTTSKKSHKSARSLRTATKPLARSLLMRWTKSAKKASSPLKTANPESELDVVEGAV